MTAQESRISTLALLVGSALLLTMATGCGNFQPDSGKNSRKEGDAEYHAPALHSLDEAPAVPYSEVYVPVDAHAYHRDGQKLPLDATLVLRNTNRESPLFIKKIDLYGQDGKRLRRVVTEPFELAPFATVEFLAKEMGTEEPTGQQKVAGNTLTLPESPPSHFIVQWGSKDGAAAPLIEAVMVDGQGQVLYARPGREVSVVQVPTRQASKPRTKVQPAPPRAYASVAPEPQYELIRYDSNMGLVAKNP